MRDAGKSFLKYPLLLKWLCLRDNVNELPGHSSFIYKLGIIYPTGRCGSMGSRRVRNYYYSILDLVSLDAKKIKDGVWRDKNHG